MATALLLQTLSKGLVDVLDLTQSLLKIAVTPDEAARTLATFIEGFDLGKTGEFWAPGGPG